MLTIIGEWVVVIAVHSPFLLYTHNRRNLEMKNKILIIAAHADDEVLGCGGTVNKFSKMGANIE